MNTMLTSSNQYLRPEYLTPLPTTLDAKKSPLALLAQTCSAIGADSPNPKLISAAEKASLKSSHKHSSDSNRDKSSPNNNNSTAAEVPVKASFKPYESCLTSRDKTRSPEERTSSGPRVRTPLSSKSTTPVQPRCASNHSSSSQRTSPHQRKSPSEKSADRSSPSQASPRPNGDSPTKIGYTPTVLTSSNDLAVKDLPLGTFKPGQGIPVSSSAFLGGLPAPGFPLPADLMTSGLLAAQHHALKSGALNPYLSYARLKAGDACRDPYCTGCSLSAHLLGGYKAGACPAGCVQCDHAKSFPPPGHPAAAYAHAQLAALAAASQLPYVCSWVAGDSAYCGKRFAGSDELLQHLRGHAAALGEAGGGSALSALGLSSSHPLLPRAYPTPPLSPLAPRFHPYSKPAHLMQHPQLPFPLPPHPSLAAYFPPYPLFGPRGLHP
ncbi:zinc finger protein elbow B isoform X2 [Arctopsyche grandis]|uniref:zinc finger protein elbow B isoform X2 n=1 Tax=Arctopsyche grandis TaxID=121162 RepID=UPI00406D6FAC